MHRQTMLGEQRWNARLFKRKSVQRMSDLVKIVILNDMYKNRNRKSIT